MRKFNIHSEFLKIARKYLRNSASPEEERFIEKYYSQFDDRDNILDELSESEKAELENKLELRLMETINAESEDDSPRIYIYRKLAAAAIVLIALSVGLYLYIGKSDSSDTLVRAPEADQKIVPGGNKALLTLADGSRINLDDAARGEIAKQAGIVISKTTDGKLIYTIRDQDLPANSNSFNKIETPNGGEYQVVLPDGTKVWLNAASSLRYPTRFAGNERKVEMTGEAYYEVAPNPLVPFRVVSKGQVVQVIGTQFNINSYADEDLVKTTLLEGSIRVSVPHTGKSDVLKPGQQSKLDPQDNSLVLGRADLEEAIAWKNGYFTFSNEDLKSIMRKVSRWYDIEVDYKGNVPSGGFGGHISKTKSITEILKILELTTGVKFKIEERRVMVIR